MAIVTGLVLFDGVDELDFVGPLDVFSYASDWGRNGRVITIGRHDGDIKGVNGLSFSSQYSLRDAPALDVIIVPGGHGTEALARDQEFLRWLQERECDARLVCSVCTGSFVLQAAGLTAGRRITTHSMLVEQLRAAGSGEVIEGERFIVDGKIVTAAGVSAGIDMALWVVGEVYGTQHAKAVRASLDYNPIPPY